MYNHAINVNFNVKTLGGEATIPPLNQNPNISNNHCVTLCVIVFIDKLTDAHSWLALL